MTTGLATTIQEGGWANARRPLPAFRGPRLLQATVIHRSDCRGSLTEEGAPSGRACSAGCADASIPAFTAIQILKLVGDAALIDLPTGGLCWVERVPLVVAPPSERYAVTGLERQAARALPPDHLTLELYLAMVPGPVFGRRNRPPKQSEIVLLRSELRAKDALTAWRYFCLTNKDNVPTMSLVSTDLRIDQVLFPSWEQRLEIPLVRDDGRFMEPRHVVLPAYPLPNGTPDPGWAHV